MNRKLAICCVGALSIAIAATFAQAQTSSTTNNSTTTSQTPTGKQKATAIGATTGAVAGAVVGLDIDDPTICHAAAKYRRPGLSFQQGDCQNLPFPNASFDLVVSFETLEHLEAGRPRAAGRFLLVNRPIR